MKLQYWGTAASEGWPALFCRCEACCKARILGGRNIRTRSQALLDDSVLLDFPADTYLHALQYNRDLSDIHHVLITHSHEDHFYPLDMILKVPPYAHNQAEQKLSVYGNKTVIEMLVQTIRTCGLPYNDVMEYLQPITLQPFTPFAMDGYTVTALLADHISHEDCYLYLIDKDGRVLLYAHDTGFFPASTWEYLQGKRMDLISIDCTFVTHSCRRNHLGLPEVVEIRKKLQEMGCVTQESQFVINHFSHNIPVLHDDLNAQARKHGFLTAYDGMTVMV